MKNSFLPTIPIPLALPIFNEEMKTAALTALENEPFVAGESVAKFEEEFAHYCGAKYAASVSSGTHALQFALMSCLNPGRTGSSKGGFWDEVENFLGVKRTRKFVITSPASFIATANAMIHAKAKPRFHDINKETYTLDVTCSMTVDDLLCILPVYLYGRPADIPELRDMADDNHVPLIADACQAHGALYKNRPVGNMEDACCFSFYPSKCMTVCGDGGMVVTNNENTAEFVKKIRNCGRKLPRQPRFHREEWTQYELIGFTSRLNTVNAAIGRVQLKYLDRWNNLRRERAEKYMSMLSGIGDIILPPKDDAEYSSSWYLFTIRTAKRDALHHWLATKSVQTGVYYPLPIHLEPVYRTLGYQEGDFPNAELLSKTCLSLPMFPDLTIEDVEYICDKVRVFYD